MLVTFLTSLRFQRYFKTSEQQERARNTKRKRNRYFEDAHCDHLEEMGFRNVARDQWMLKAFHLTTHCEIDTKTIYYILRYNHKKKAQSAKIDFILSRTAELVEARQCGVPPALW